MRQAAALALAALALLAGCNTFEDDAQRTNARSTAFTFPAAFTTADARIITERPDPVTGRSIVCTEPSPDVAKAISTAFALSGQGGNGSTSAGLGTSAGSAEAVAELAGRSTALLGLRDGLFQACQAYANGAIGPEMYALIISRYGQLMTTLFLGQDISSMPQPVAVAASPGITASATAPGSGSGNSNTQVQIAGTPPSSQPGTAPGAVSGAANAVVRMNEDYLNLDHNLLHTIAVACINRSDPAVAAEARSRGSDPWLRDVCNNLKLALSTPAGMAQMAGLASGLVQNRVVGAPVDPTVTTTLSGPPAAAAKASAAPKSGAAAAAKCVTPSAAQKVMAEKVLVGLNYLPNAPSTPLKNFDEAILSFENGETPKIPDPGCPKGQIAPQTLAALQVLAATPKQAP